MPAINIADLPESARARVRAATGRKRIVGARTFTAEHERRWALRVCALVAELTQDQRARVLKRAARVNAV